MIKQITAELLKVTDGDTLYIKEEITHLIYICRLANIDAPEIKQEYGQEAKDFLQNLLHNKELIVYIESNKDTYGRFICNIYTDNETIWVNEKMIEYGLAWVYKKYTSDNKLLLLENNARKQKVGLWKSDKPFEPWLYRKENKFKK